MDNDKNKKFKLIDIVKNKQYYAIANLVFGFSLIIILIIMARAAPKTNNINNGVDSSNKIITSSAVGGFEYIKSKNFNFKYTLSVDKTKTIYEGKQYQNKVLFKDVNSNKEYFMQDSIVLKKEDKNFVLGENPVQYFNYISVDLIEKILSKAVLDYGEYVVSISEFSKIIESDKTEDGDIYIEFTKKNNIITQIIIDFTEFVNIDKENIKEAIVTLEYSNFNLIEDFNINQK